MSPDTPGAPTLNASAYSGLFQAVGGLRNGRAFAAMTGCAVAGVIVAGLIVATGGAFSATSSLLAALVWFVAIGTGVNAAGLLHMDTARGISPRSLVDALVQGLMCIPKLVLLAIVVLLAEIAVFLVIAVLLLICKIPFLGPLLFAVVFPVSVVAAGITVVGLFLGVTLSIPAIWQGATIGRALAQTFAIVRSRLVESVLLLLVVGFLSFAVGAVVFGTLGAGLMPTLGMSASIVGFGGMGGGMGGFGGMPVGMGSGGHAVAGAIGGLVLWAIAVSLVAQVYLLGLCLVYLRVTEGLDLTAAEATLRGKLEEARKRAAELGDKAKSAARPDASVAAAPVSAPTAAPVAGVAGVAGVAAAAATGGAVAAMAPSGTPVAPPTAWDDEVTIAPIAPIAPAAPAPSPLAPKTPAPAADPFGVSPLSDETVQAAAADIELPIDAPAPLEPPAALATCPQCRAAVTPDDVFCGVCGYRLK